MFLASFYFYAYICNMATLLNGIVGFHEFVIELQVMMNSMNVPSKRSTLERKLDRLILTLFVVLFCMCLIGAIGRCDNC